MQIPRVACQLRIDSLEKEMTIDLIRSKIDEDEIERICMNAKKAEDKKNDELKENSFYEAIDWMDPEQMKHFVPQLKKKIGKDEVKQFLKLREEEHPEYRMLLENRENLYAQEKGILEKAGTIYRDHHLWDFCKIVRGLGNVAAMTILGYVNPEILQSAGQVFKMVGMTPESKLVKGVKGTYSPEVKGRFWLLQRNVLLANDPFYKELYDIQKEYYQHRPDLLLDKIGECPHKKADGTPEHPKFATGMTKKDKELGYVKGWAAWMDRKARLWVGKLIISHCAEIIVNAQAIHKFPRHHNYVPMKSEDEAENMRVTMLFRESRTILSGMQKENWKKHGEILKTPGILD